MGSAAAKRFNAGLLDFLRRSPTPFHATANLAVRLREAGYAELKEGDAWRIAPRGRYFITRNGSSLIAFRLGRVPLVEGGLRLVGAHTDSPCLRLKPNAIVEQAGYVKCGVEVYGGVLLNPWFDRDLSLAGRVTLRDKRGQLTSALIDFERAVAIIPSLAIHLDREANDHRSINKQTMLPPVLALAGGEPFDLPRFITQALKRQHPALARAELLDFELSFYDTQPPAMVGVEEEFIASARLDNLLSCHTGLEALLGNDADTAQLFIASDHEEVGSTTSAGARGNFLKSVLERLAGGDEAFARIMARSLLVSTDNAHGIHPNFADKHDGRHGPVLNKGPVVKVNSNQSYATNSESAALFKHAAHTAKVELQAFVTRTDMGCGGTIGPMTAAGLGVRTVDVGVPTFAMHSIRELAGSEDAYALQRVLRAFYALPDLGIASA